MTDQPDSSCIPNINDAQRRKRLLGGGVMLVVSLAILAVLVAAGFNPWTRLWLFPLFFGAASGYFQWRDKT